MFPSMLVITIIPRRKKKTLISKFCFPFYKKGLLKRGIYRVFITNSGTSTKTWPNTLLCFYYLRLSSVAVLAFEARLGKGSVILCRVHGSFFPPPPSLLRMPAAEVVKSEASIWLAATLEPSAALSPPWRPCPRPHIQPFPLWSSSRCCSILRSTPCLCSSSQKRPTRLFCWRQNSFRQDEFIHVFFFFLL